MDLLRSRPRERSLVESQTEDPYTSTCVEVGLRLSRTVVVHGSRNLKNQTFVPHPHTLDTSRIP